MKIFPLALALTTSLLTVTPAFAKTVRINFARGSYCGSYQGKIRPGDVFLINLNAEQRFDIKTSEAISMTVKNSRTGAELEPVDTIQNNDKTFVIKYFTRQKGDHKIIISESLNMADIQFCAYQGEGE